MAKIISSSLSNSQMSSGTGDVSLAYGKGTKTYGGQMVQGRENQNQITVQGTGYSPAEDYRPSPYLPGLWRDLDRNGCPVVLEGGSVVGVARVSEAALTNERQDTHFLVPANAGIPQSILYGTDDVGIAVDIDAQTVTSGTIATTAVAASGAATTNVLAGTAPIGYIATPSHSVAWQLRNRNQKFQAQTSILTSDLVMYPVADGFMYGGSFVASGAVASFISGTVYTPAKVGVTDVSIANATYALSGIRTGDKVMPNPYMPGRLISVGDFVKMALLDTTLKAKVVTAISNAFGITTAIDDNATATAETGLGLLVAYAMQHVVGTCFKRQTRATWNNTDAAFGAHDIYSDTYRYFDSVEELGLAGAQTAGIEADQIAAYDYAKAAGASNLGIDVVFINYNLK